MDINIFRGIVTGVLLALFVWLCIWAWGKARKPGFDQAARIPLEDKPEDRPLEEEPPR